MVGTPSLQISNSSRPKASLEIIPDSRFIVFHGSEHEATSVKLTGRVRLTTSEPTTIMRPRVRLEGKRKIRWYYLGPVSHSIVEDKRIFWNEEQKLGVETPHKVKAGTMEWAFEFTLDPSMPESVEGLRESHIVYHLHASVSRPGWNAKDVLAQEHVRLVRTLGPESMETTRSRVNTDTWANKVAYSISIPSDAVVFGTSITADVELTPLKKGIRLGKIELKLLETVVRRIQASEQPDIRGDRSKSEELEVAKQEMEFPENSRMIYEDETSDNPTMADEMYKFQATLPLPKSLNLCRQDVDLHQLNVTHRFKLMVNIHNPEGHTSQLVCRLPVKLFISPNLPVDESNRVRASVDRVMSDAELNQNEASAAAPPQYGQHQLDQIYSDVDLSGFLSRAGSGFNTPAGLMAQSRRGSHDNIWSLNGVAAAVQTDSAAADHLHGSAVPQLLHSRLANLQGDSAHDGTTLQSRTEHSPSGGNSPAATDQVVSSRVRFSTSPNHVTSPIRSTSSRSLAAMAGGSGSGSSSSSAGPSSQRNSGDDHTSSITQHDYDLNDLSRVPSYGAALRAAPPVITPLGNGLPSYVEATSRPPSPTLQAVHGTTFSRSGSLAGNLDLDASTLAAQGSLLSDTTGAAGSPPQSYFPRTTSHHDEQARLRTLRAGV